MHVVVEVCILTTLPRFSIIVPAAIQLQCSVGIIVISRGHLQLESLAPLHHQRFARTELYVVLQADGSASKHVAHLVCIAYHLCIAGYGHGGRL